MKKIIVIGVSILSVFILYSLSYQPIVADEPIEQIIQQEFEFKETDDDRGCKDTKYEDFPIICFILEVLFAGLGILWFWLGSYVAGQ